MQYGACALHAGYLTLQINTQNMLHLLLFHYNIGCRNALLLRYAYISCLVFCPKRPDRPWDSPILFIGYWVCFHSSVEFRNEWSRASAAHICLHDVGRDNFTLILRTHKPSYPSTLSSRGGQLVELWKAQIREGSFVSKIIFLPSNMVALYLRSSDCSRLVPINYESPFFRSITMPLTASLMRV